MVGAMLVLVVVVVGFVALRDLNRVAPEGPGGPVDYRQSAEFAQQAADFEILAPRRLPPGWRVTSVDFVPEPARWHLGQLTDEDRYVGLEQSGGSVRSMVETYVDDEPVKGDDVRIDGETWNSWSDDGGDHALVRETENVTTLVVGPVEPDVLVGYVRSLR